MTFPIKTADCPQQNQTAKSLGISQPAVSTRKQRMIREGRLEPTIVKVMREDFGQTTAKILNKGFTSSSSKV